MTRLAIACALLALFACAPASAQAPTKCVVPLNYNGPATINYATKFMGLTVFTGTMTTDIDAAGLVVLFDAPAGSSACNFSALTPALKASLASTAVVGTVGTTSCEFCFFVRAYFCGGGGSTTCEFPHRRAGAGGKGRHRRRPTSGCGPRAAWRALPLHTQYSNIPFSPSPSPSISRSLSLSLS